MKMDLLTRRQKEILRYRAQGLTQQQIADITNTSKSNISIVERSARENIQRAKEALDFLHTLNALPLCTLKENSDLFDGVSFIQEEAAKTGIPVTLDPLDLINRIRSGFPQRIHGRHIREDIEVFLRNDGELLFG